MTPNACLSWREFLALPLKMVSAVPDSAGLDLDHDESYTGRDG